MIPLELFKKSKEEKLSAMEAKWVEDQLKIYPYFSMLHFIHAKVAHHNNKDNSKDLASIASIYSNDRKKTANYIQQSLKTIFKPSSEILNEIPATEEKVEKVAITKEYIPKGPRVGMIDWKIQTVIQIRVQMFTHITKLLTQEMENFKKPKISNESNFNPLSLNLAENILNLLNINLLELATNPNINPSGVMANSEVPTIKEKEQNVKGDTKTDFFAEKLAKLRETNEELKKLKKITSDSMKRFVEPNFDKRTYITEIDEEIFNAKLEEQKQKVSEENSLNPPVVKKQDNVEVIENQNVVQKVPEIKPIVEEKQEVKQEIKNTESKKQNIIQNITSDSMKRFKPLTFEEEVPNNIQETTQIENIEVPTNNNPLVEENVVKEEVKTEKNQKSQEPLQNISTDSFKRFVPLEIEPTESSKKETPIQKKEIINENIPKNISTDSFKRFVTPEFDLKSESLKSKNLEQSIQNKETSSGNQEVINEVVKKSKVDNTIKKSELTGKQDSLKRFVEPEFDNVIKTPKQEDTSLSRFVKPEFDENSKKSFKTEDTVIEVQSTKYVIELVVKKDKIHHYFKKDIVSKIIEVHPELTENPILETLNESPVLETINENPAIETVTESPVLETVTESPVLETVTENPVLETVTENPVLETVNENPAIETVTESPVTETVTENPVLETVNESPIIETVNESPAFETVTESPVLETVTESPIIETVTESPIIETVNENPVLETVTESPVLETVTESPIIETVTESPIIETVNENPVLETVTESPVLETVTESPVLEAVTENPVLETVTESPVLEAVTENPVLETVNESPIIETVNENPVTETITENPVLETVTESPVLETVTESPVLETVNENPVLETVTENPVLETVTENPVLETVNENPVLETVTENPALETVTESPILETVNESPALETVTESPVLETVNESPVTETVNENPVLETVNESPVTETVNENPVESEIQKPYHELINIERLENRIAGHKKKAEIIGKKAQVSSEITLKSLQNKFLQSIIKAKPDKKEKETVSSTHETELIISKNNNIDDILEKIKQLENKFSSIQQLENKNDSFQIIEQENEDNHDLSDEIITETMAKIFLVQGDILKSIKIYKKLMERNPKKREYFEQKIKEIESK